MLMPAPRPEITCSACVYFEKTGSNFGECRHYAPHPNASFFVSRSEATGAIKTDVHWPKVYDTNWCGEFAKAQ